MVSIKEFVKSKKKEKRLSLNNWPLSRPVSAPWSWEDHHGAWEGETGRGKLFQGHGQDPFVT